MIYINGKFNGKYIECRDRNGKLHRDNGPAVIGNNYQTWYRYGKYHRLDGPAVIGNNYQTWYIEGVYYKEQSYYDKLKEMGL